jgi:hypothetical protein
MAVAYSEGLGHTAKPCRLGKTEVEDGKDFNEFEAGSLMCVVGCQSATSKKENPK